MSTYGTLEVWREGWTASNSKGRWVALRPAHKREAEASAASKFDGRFWLDGDTQQPYNGYMARHTYDQAARVVPAEQDAGLAERAFAAIDRERGE
jgi:hypothetical protein